MSDFFDRLETQLRRAAAPVAEPAAPRRPRRRALAVVTGAVLLAAVPASAAMLGAFEPQEEPDDLVRTAPKALVAQGNDPEFGAWEATRSQSTDGECLGLRLVDPPGPQPGSTSEGCGSVAEPARIGGGSGAGRTAMFGYASPRARQVRIVADNHPGRTFPTHPVAASDRSFFFASLPVNAVNPRIVALDGDGREVR